MEEVQIGLGGRTDDIGEVDGADVDATWIYRPCFAEQKTLRQLDSLVGLGHLHGRGDIEANASPRCDRDTGRRAHSVSGGARFDRAAPGGGASR